MRQSCSSVRPPYSIIDTDVIIWDLRGNERARDTIARNVSFRISVVTYVEAIQGMRSKQELHAFLRQLRRWAVTILTAPVGHDISLLSSSDGQGGSWSTSMWQRVWTTSRSLREIACTRSEAIGRGSTLFASTISGVFAFDVEVTDYH